MLVLYLGSAILCLALCLAANRIGYLLRVIDHPDGTRKLHTAPTPLIGGLAVALPFIGVTVAMAALNAIPPTFLALAAATGILLILGYLDDRHEVAALTRLLVSFLVCVVVVIWEPGFAVDQLAFTLFSLTVDLPTPASVAFSVLCIVGLQYSLNMADGKNGLVIGILTVWTIILINYAPGEVRTLLAFLCAYLAIALFFNLSGRLFLGDAGTYSLSVIIGFLTIYCYGRQATPMAAEVPMLLFLVPILDCLRIMLHRLRTGHSPFSPDQHHLHHYLARHMRWEYGLIIYLVLVAVPNTIATVFPSLLTAMVILTIAAYGSLIFAMTRRQHPKPTARV